MKDLFETPEELPPHIQDIINRFEEREEACVDGYASCEQLLTELEQEGYTCEYYLDACPFNLQKL